MAIQTSPYYTDEELREAAKLPVPSHIAVIPDGNRRWAKKQSTLSLMKGHWAGASVVTSIVEAASDLGVKTLTIYAFSTENWSRPALEVKTLMEVFAHFLRENRERMREKGVRFTTIGDLTPFPPKIREEIALTKEMTALGEKIELVLAMNYGARDEMRRAFTSMATDLEEGRLAKEQISEKVITRYLDTASYKDPELLIRTSGEQRISNFLLWQMAYTEVFVTDVLWPDFTPRDLFGAVLDFQKRHRRLGK